MIFEVNLLKIATITQDIYQWKYLKFVFDN